MVQVHVKAISCRFKSCYQHQLGSIAQLGEHLPYKQRVTGSSPVVPTKKRVPIFRDSFFISIKGSNLEKVSGVKQMCL